MTYRYSIQKHNGSWCVMEEGLSKDHQRYSIIWKHRLKSEIKKFAKDMVLKDPSTRFIGGEFIIPSNYEFKN